jgi:hypothetical protein
MTWITTVIVTGGLALGIYNEIVEPVAKAGYEYVQEKLD